MTYLVLVANPGDDTITSFHLENGSDGDRLVPLASNAVPSCGTFAVDGERDLVFAASKQGPALITYRLDRPAGTLTEAHRLPLDAPLAYVDLSADGRTLALASYHGNFGATHLVGDDGVVGPEVSRVTHRNIHSGVISPDDGSVYFCSLGEDLVVQCALDDDARLWPLDPPTVACPLSSGPRHIVLTPEGSQAYLVTEFSGQVLHFTRDLGTGVLTPADTLSIVDPDAGLAPSAYGRDPKQEHLVWGADVHWHDDRLWATERCASTLATAPASPDLGPVLSFAATEEQPRGFALSPDGTRAVVVGELSGQASLYDVTGDTPQLLHRVPTGAGAIWVRIIEA